MLLHKNKYSNRSRFFVTFHDVNSLLCPFRVQLVSRLREIFELLLVYSRLGNDLGQFAGGLLKIGSRVRLAEYWIARPQLLFTFGDLT